MDNQRQEIDSNLLSGNIPQKSPFTPVQMDQTPQVGQGESEIQSSLSNHGGFQQAPTQPLTQIPTFDSYQEASVMRNEKAGGGGIPTITTGEPLSQNPSIRQPLPFYGQTSRDFLQPNSERRSPSQENISPQQTTETQPHQLQNLPVENNTTPPEDIKREGEIPKDRYNPTYKELLRMSGLNLNTLEENLTKFRNGN